VGVLRDQVVYVLWSSVKDELEKAENKEAAEMLRKAVRGQDVSSSSSSSSLVSLLSSSSSSSEPEIKEAAEMLRNAIRREIPSFASHLVT
jgi:hypothetical protein